MLIIWNNNAYLTVLLGDLNEERRESIQLYVSL